MLLQLSPPLKVTYDGKPAHAVILNDPGPGIEETWMIAMPTGEMFWALTDHLLWGHPEPVA